MKFIKTIAAAVFMSASVVSAQTLNIGTLPAADSIVLMVAEDEGLFKEQGLDVKTIPFKSALEIGAAMRGGQLAGHFGDLMNVFTQNETGAPQAVILTTTFTSVQQRAFGLVVSPKFKDEIKDLASLKETETAMSAATIIDYLLDRMKAEEKLADNALVNKEIRQIPIRLQMLLSGQVKTALLPEPLVTLVEKKGGNVIWDDTKLNEPLAVVALKKEYLDDKTVGSFKKAVAEAAKRIEADPDKYRALMVDKRLLPKDAADSYKMIRFSLFNQEDGLPPLPGEQDVRRVAEWMMGRGMIKSIPQYSEVIFAKHN